MPSTAETHLARLGDDATCKLLGDMGFGWSALDRNVCAAARYRRRVADGPAVVGFVGGASSGKSTLFNSLQGREVSRISAHAHETCGPVAAVHERWLAPIEEWTREGLLFPGLQLVAQPAGEATTGSSGTIHLHRHDCGELSDVLVVDMPDVTSKMSADEGSVSRTLLPWFDALVVVVDEERWFDAVVFDETVDFARNLGPQAWIVFNQTAGADALTEEDRRRLSEHARARHASGCCFSPYQPGAGFRPVNGATREHLASWLSSVDAATRGTELERHLQRRCAELVHQNVTRAEQFSELRHAVDRELEELTRDANLTTDLLTEEERGLLGLGHRFLPLYEALQTVRRQVARWSGRGRSDKRIDFDKRTQALAATLRRNLEHRFRRATDRIDRTIGESAYVAGEGSAWDGRWALPEFDEHEWARRIRAHIDAWRSETGKHARRSDAAALGVGAPLLLADLLFLGGAGFTLGWTAAWVTGLFGAKSIATLVQRSPAFKEYQTTVRAYQAFIRETLTEQCERNMTGVPRRHLASTDPVHESLLYWSTPGRR